MVQVRVPTPLRKLTGGADSVEADGASVAAIVRHLDEHYPGMKDRICDETGAVRRFVNIFVNGEDIRFLQQLDTPVKTGDELSIVPAIAGGR
jgi:molybdopterin synthase sulfur carrier subunit